MSDTLAEGGSIPVGVQRQAVARQLHQLLARLDADPERAGSRYEELRRRLILFFRLRCPYEAEDLADKALDRLARRLSEGVEIEEPEAYVAGVARFILRERGSAGQREQRAERDAAYERKMHLGSEQDGLQQANIAALEKCLQQLTDGDRSMILDYYSAEGASRIHLRQSLAEKLGISQNALHNRALRLRKQLERCVESRVSQERG
jgi:DNA-directed RNA polymerase specialized sigma24 family protein